MLGCSFIFTGSRAWFHERMAEKYEERVEVKGTNRCPIFSGMEEDYENWRILASDWMEIEGNKREYPGLEMRADIRGKALDVVVGIPQVDLKGDEGTERLIKELEKYYQKESRTYKLMKLKELMNIKRGMDESMEEYIRRYEKVARDLKSAGGEYEGVASVGTGGIRRFGRTSSGRGLSHTGGI